MNEKTETYPEISFRGLSQKDWVDENGFVLPGAFQLGTGRDGQMKREDGFAEISINWNDDENALVDLKNAKKSDSDGKLIRQFGLGYCEIDTFTMKNALKAQISIGNFSYERAPICDIDTGVYNPYHGNLLIKNELKPAIKKLIQNTLASIAGFSKAWDDE